MRGINCWYIVVAVCATCCSCCWLCSCCCCQLCCCCGGCCSNYFRRFWYIFEIIVRSVSATFNQTIRFEPQRHHTFIGTHGRWWRASTVPADVAFVLICTLRNLQIVILTSRTSFHIEKVKVQYDALVSWRINGHFAIAIRQIASWIARMCKSPTVSCVCDITI